MTQVVEIPVVCVVLIRNKKVFLAQRLEPEFLAGKWEFPGGKIESNESELEALHREIKEELNITLHSPTHFFKWDYFAHDRVLKFVSFIVRSWTGEFSLTEHSALKWVHWTDLDKNEMPEADAPLVDELILQASTLFSP